MFLKSEIDDWLHDGKMKSQKNLNRKQRTLLSQNVKDISNGFTRFMQWYQNGI